jgi:hypothetical protein
MAENVTEELKPAEEVVDEAMREFPNVKVLEKEREPVTVLPPVTPITDSLAQTLETALTPEQVGYLVDQLRARIEAEKQLRTAILSKTNYRDWVGFRAEGEGEDAYQPYLMGVGAVKLGGPFGVEKNWDPVTVDKQDDGTMLAWMMGRARAHAYSQYWEPVYASRWSGDGFFTGTDGKGAYDPGDLIKSCWDNFNAECVRVTLGMASVTWDELKAAGIKIDRIPKSVFGSKGKGGGNTGAGAHDLKSGPHMEVYVPYDRKDLQATIKGLQGRTFDGQKKCWLVTLTKTNLSSVRDLAAANEGVVKIQYANVDGNPEDVAK